MASSYVGIWVVSSNCMAIDKSQATAEGTTAFPIGSFQIVKQMALLASLSGQDIYIEHHTQHYYSNSIRKRSSNFHYSHFRIKF